ncbi:hypothetical protein [Tsuneonella amylolytica]|uniref:hypothetical protein n=1 Tax=Tsuneonella amylolytica TaxID=2338327 RepID=UPI000EA88063|nr:hypothetical protein [Tsuneonella amylolytica]
MSVRFAAARHAARSPVARVLARPVILHVANDDGDAAAEETRILHETLRHFAIHGLGSFAQARLRADAAMNRGDRAEHARWMKICRLLDRRLAEQKRVPYRPS